MEIFLLGILGFFIGAITSISGGGGVLGIPIMLLFNIPPVQVLALNRISDIGVILGALDNYRKVKAFDWHLIGLAVIPLGVGAFIGANISLNLPEYILKCIMVVGVLIGIFFILRPIHEQENSQSEYINAFGGIALFFVGIWSGMLGMAGATFGILVIVHFFQKTFLQARGLEMMASIPETIISACVLSWGSKLNWAFAAVILLSSLLGAFLGSKLTIKKGDIFLKKVMVTVALLMLGKLLFDLIQQI